MSYLEHAAHLRRHLEVGPFSDRLVEVCPAARDADLMSAVIDAAASFAQGELAPGAAAFEREPPALIDGKVIAGAEQSHVWDAFRAMGWLSIGAPEPVGQGQPLDVLVACEEMFNRASAAFYMLPTATRCGASLLQECAPERVRSEWLARLLAGDWSATICISEPEAGSDVGRIRTAAAKGADGWTVNGEKCWISYGDHNLVGRIGHLMLARSNALPGVRGLSLFLVPSTRDDGSSNGVRVSRLEEKMGLHASPTCGLLFEQSEAHLLGEEGCGLQHMFHMMLEMRLSCGPQGIGVASAAYEIARGYAAERRQGGAADARPVPITEHADVQRQLLSMAAAVETGRALNIACAQVLELSRRAEAEAARAQWSALAQFLLPLVKDNAAWSACETTSQAVQVLGGAGYTREWPVEQLMRDARVFPIFEGTTGIQALDIVHRRLWRDKRAGLDAFLEIARAHAARTPASEQLFEILAQLDEAAGQLMQWQGSPRDAEAGAVAFLELCKLAVKSWLASVLIVAAGTDATGLRITAAAKFFLIQAGPEAVKQRILALRGSQVLAGFDDLRAA